MVHFPFSFGLSKIPLPVGMKMKGTDGTKKERTKKKYHPERTKKTHPESTRSGALNFGRTECWDFWEDINGILHHLQLEVANGWVEMGHGSNMGGLNTG